MLGEICGWPIERFDTAELKGGGYIRELTGGRGVVFASFQKPANDSSYTRSNQ